MNIKELFNNVATKVTWIILTIVAIWYILDKILIS